MHVHMHVHRDEVTGQTWYCFTFPTHTRKAPSFYILFIKYKRFFLGIFGRRVAMQFYTDFTSVKNPGRELIQSWLP